MSMPIENAIKRAKEVSYNINGEAILNYSFIDSQAALVQRNDRFVVIMLGGEEFGFDTFQEAAIFSHAFRLINSSKWQELEYAVKDMFHPAELEVVCENDELIIVSGSSRMKLSEYENQCM